MMPWQIERLKRDYVLYTQEMETLLNMKPRHPAAGIPYLSQYIQETAQKLIDLGIDPRKLENELGTLGVAPWGGNVTTSEPTPADHAPVTGGATSSYTVPENVTLTESEGEVFAQVSLAGTRAFIGQFDSMPAAIKGVKVFFLSNKPYLITGQAPPRRTAKNQEYCSGPNCKARITWLKTANGSPMPVDDWIRVYDGEWKKHMGTHWETCPDAKEFKAK